MLPQVKLLLRITTFQVLIMVARYTPLCIISELEREGVPVGMLVLVSKRSVRASGSRKFTAYILKRGEGVVADAVIEGGCNAQ
jgi:hypothetical protein